MLQKPKTINQNKKMQKYIIKQKIGVGSFGQVYLVHDSIKNEKLALKKMKTHFNSQSEVNELMEVKILSKLNHPNIIDLKQAIYDKETQQGSVIFQYCESDILKKFCNKRKQHAPQIQIKKLIFQVASALSYVHAKNYIHRDLKPENILIQENEFEGKTVEVAKLCDFGISKKADELPLTDYIGTRWYRAPQLLIKMKNYSKTVDIFSLGCIMAELYNLQILFNGKNANEQLVLIMKKLGTPTKETWPEFSNWCKLKGISFGKYEKSQDPIIFKAKMDDQAENLIQKMLVMNPKNRITAADMLNHSYFDEVREEMLARQLAARPLKFNDFQVQNYQTRKDSLKSESQIKTNCVSQGNIDEIHTSDKKSEHQSVSRQLEFKKQPQKQSKQTQSIGSSNNTQQPNQPTTRPPIEIHIIPSPQKPQPRSKPPAYYSPYSSNVSNLATKSPSINHNTKSQKKFDYFQTYVMAKKSQDRIHTTYEINSVNYASNNSSGGNVGSSSSYHVNSSNWSSSKKD